MSMMKSMETEMQKMTMESIAMMKLMTMPMAMTTRRKQLMKTKQSHVDSKHLALQQVSRSTMNATTTVPALQERLTKH